MTKKDLTFEDVVKNVDQSRPINDLELWVYISCHGRSNANVRVIYGISDTFKIITSRHVAHCDVGMNVGYDYSRNSGMLLAIREATRIMRNFDEFLERTIGTHDRRSKEYKKLLQKEEDLKVYVMKQKVLGKI